MLIAQITDTHIRRKGDLLHHMIHTGRELRRAVAELNGLRVRPDFVLATGDLVDKGKGKEYRRLRTILDGLTMPVYLVAGNHDDRDALRQTFDDHTYLPRRGPLQYVVESRPVRLVVLDTTHGRARHGELDGRRLTWLDARLSEARGVPTLVAMHHPPFDLGIPAVDSKPLRGRDELSAVVAAHPQVARIVCGHVHREHETPFAGTIASSAPSTAHQLVLVRAPGGYAVRVEAPGYALHAWLHGALRTVVARIGERTELRAVS